jgi:hypothetical protein
MVTWVRVSFRGRRRRPVARRLWAAGRRVSQCLEHTQSEIPRFARNDSMGRVITQTALGRGLPFLAFTPNFQRKMWDMLGASCRTRSAPL